MRNQYLSLVGPKVSWEPRGVESRSSAPPSAPSHGDVSVPSRDPLYLEMAEILERAASAVDEASGMLRTTARYLRG